MGIKCKVFAPDFNEVFSAPLTDYNFNPHQSVLYHNDRITNRQTISTITEKIISIEVDRSKIQIWYESGAHVELSK